jgi:hypothetical protein
MSAPAAAPIDHVAPITMDPGGTAVLSGAMRTSIDGSVFDAVMQWDTFPIAATHPGGMYDLAAGGLKIVEQHPDTHTYIVAPMGTPGSACALANIESPCLVPRLAVLAHERLHTSSELAATLSGGIETELHEAPPPAPNWAGLAIFGAMLVVLVGTLAVGAWLHAGSRSLIGRVRAAARAARRATKGDVTLAGVRARIEELVLRAQKLEVVRKASLGKLRGIERVGLERERDAWARCASADAPVAVEQLTAECAEAARLESELASSVAGLERIASALRLVALRTRQHRGTRARVAVGDPVDALDEELALRDEAIREAERAA